jgi:hypothetical protein
VQLAVEKEMVAVQQHSATFEAKVEERISISYFKGLAKRARDSDPLYSNRFKDSLKLIGYKPLKLPIFVGDVGRADRLMQPWS